MSKFIYQIFILFLFTSGLTYSQWINTYNGQGNSDDRGHGIVVDASDNIYTVGYTTNDTTGIDIIILKYTNTGEPIWQAVYSGTGNYTDRAHGIVVDNSGNVYVTGYTTSTSGNINYLTLKYNSNGALQWAKTFNGSGNQTDKAWGIVVDDNSNCFITGTSKSSSSGTDIVTLKYNSSGNVVWTKTYDAPPHKDEEAVKIAIDGNNNLYIAGYGEYSSGHHDFLLLKYSHSGSFQWVKNYNGSNGGFDRAWGIVIDNEDYIYITGESEGSNDKFDIVTIKYNYSGTQKWLYRFTETENEDDKPYGIVVDEITGSVFVTGSTETNNNGMDYLTLRLNKSTGALGWAKLFNGGGNDNDIPYALTTTKNGQNPYIIVTGTVKQYSSGSDDIAIIVYNAEGILRNVNVYGGTAEYDDGAFGITVDNNDNYFIAGFVSNTSAGSGASAPNYDIVTVKHERINPVGIITPLVNVPGNYYLSQNYPNPFNPETIISFGIPENSNVNISVYDITGKFIQNLVNSNLSRGSYNVSFNGNSLSSGIYIYRITAGRFTETKTMILIK